MVTHIYVNNFWDTVVLSDGNIKPMLLIFTVMGYLTTKTKNNKMAWIKSIHNILL